MIHHRSNYVLPFMHFIGEIYENAFAIFFPSLASNETVLVNIIRNNSYMALNYCNQSRSNSYDETFGWRHIQQAVDMFQSATES